MKSIHTPVLLKEVIELLAPKKDNFIIDATLGGGGHSDKFLEILGTSGKLLVLDADKSAVLRFKEKNTNKKNVFYSVANFSEIKEIVENKELGSPDVILFDFGLSSDQLDDSERGFSFQKNGPLDMRLNQSEQKSTARNILSDYSEQDLRQIFKKYGEEKNYKSIARAIVREREENEIKTTDQLYELIKKSVPLFVRFKSNDIARRIFQALRIEVNQELESLEKGLNSAFEILSPGGRIGAISFHSLEDRIVKQTFSKFTKGCVCPPEFPICVCGKNPLALNITKKAIIPSEEEQKNNSRSKSAKLRVIKKQK